MKYLDIKSIYRHDIPINKKYKKKPNKNAEQNHTHETSDRIEDIIIKNPRKIKTKSKSQHLKGGTIKPEDITDEYIDILIK